MRKLILFALVAMLAPAAFPSTAQAQTIEECQSLIAQTSNDPAGVTIGGNNPDQARAGLQSKLVGASTKLAEGKNDDAIAKLVDFQTSVADYRCEQCHCLYPGLGITSKIYIDQGPVSSFSQWGHCPIADHATPMAVRVEIRSPSVFSPATEQYFP